MICAFILCICCVLCCFGQINIIAAQRYYVHKKTSFLENRKDTKVVYPVTWTYDICAFDTGTYYDYY